ncbi:MAG: ABC transporter permease [Defluviitaleaceae bacterium]|nr:ABC transporter permease [Defluviitaleaceae bacterium]
MKQKWLAAPYIIWIALFVIVPMFFVVYSALTANMHGTRDVREQLNDMHNRVFFVVRDARGLPGLLTEDLTEINNIMDGVRDIRDSIRPVDGVETVRQIRPFAYLMKDYVDDLGYILRRIGNEELIYDYNHLQVIAAGLVELADNARDIAFSIDGFRRAFTPGSLSVLWLSVWVAALSTLLCLIIGYPVALILAGRDFSMKATLLLLFALPMWMNYLLRTIAWQPILERSGILNNILGFIGLPPVDILFTHTAVILVMVYNFLPFMILPVFTSLSKIDYSLIESAQDLGANSFTVFRKVIFPLSVPGVVSGITMVFMPATATFIVPQLIGGGQYWMIGNQIFNQFLNADDPNFGSALSLILMAIMLLTMLLLGRIDRNNGEGALMN